MKTNIANKYKYLIVPIGEEGDPAFRAIIPKFSNIHSFADTVKELHEVVVEMITEEIGERKNKKIPIPEPDTQPKDFNGRILLRIDPEMHAELALQAQANEMSLNKYLAQKLQAK